MNARSRKRKALNKTKLPGKPLNPNLIVVLHSFRSAILEAHDTPAAANNAAITLDAQLSQVAQTSNIVPQVDLAEFMSQPAAKFWAEKKKKEGRGTWATLKGIPVKHSPIYEFMEIMEMVYY